MQKLGGQHNERSFFNYIKVVAKSKKIGIVKKKDFYKPTYTRFEKKICL